MNTLEKIEKDKIKAYLDYIGAFYFSAFMAGYGRSGIPDIIACLPSGRFAGIEVKAEGEEPTPWQQRCLDNITMMGGLAVWGTAESVIAQLTCALAADR